MNDGNAKQQIVEKIKSTSNILVTVSTDPSVDELSAALGLTILLNKMNKHTTAVFSGAIPAAIDFLDPTKTFESTVDSLRDFIIALDKEKADHLRYKVEGDVVKIFITPYRTTITSEDLDFSQGDYNVELVLALGVEKRENLDKALMAHGRILHDATVATISAGEMKSELGGMNWRERNASSLSEMLMSITESLKSDKVVIDEQIATAFLTGIVAATDRFSNNKTSSKVMTIAAQLMAAGANQQLIASKLEEANEIGRAAVVAAKLPPEVDDNDNADGTTDLSEGETTKLNHAKADKSPKEVEQPKADDGSLSISHMPIGDVDEVAAITTATQQQDAAVAAQDQLDRRSEEVAAQQQDEAAQVAEQNLADQLSSVATIDTPAAAPITADDLLQDAAIVAEPVPVAPEMAAPAYEPELTPVAAPESTLSGAVSPDVWRTQGPALPVVAPMGTPALGGTLNATTEQAAEDKRREDEQSRNRTILSHGESTYISEPSTLTHSPINSAASALVDEAPMADPFAQLAPTPEMTPPTGQAPTIEPLMQAPTLATIDEQNRQTGDDARAAIDAAFGSIDPALQPLPPSPFEPQPVVGDPYTPELPPLPPLPDFSTLPPLPALDQYGNPEVSLPPERLEDVFAPAPAPEYAPQPPAPGQFRIPGQ